jgi:hypothetical protein
LYLLYLYRAQVPDHGIVLYFSEAFGYISFV